ncbi:MAG TPA: hypothetical protein VF941_03980 [Clostridia bacterium]
MQSNWTGEWIQMVTIGGIDSNKVTLNCIEQPPKVTLSQDKSVCNANDSYTIYITTTPALKNQPINITRWWKPKGASAYTVITGNIGNTDSNGSFTSTGVMLGDWAGEWIQMVTVGGIDSNKITLIEN